MLDLTPCDAMKSVCMGGCGKTSGCDVEGSGLAEVSWPVNLRNACQVCNQPKKQMWSQAAAVYWTKSDVVWG